jgi:hypothetical protein
MIKRFSSPFFILKKRHFFAGSLVISLCLNSGFTVSSDFASVSIGVTAPQEEVK